MECYLTALPRQRDVSSVSESTNERNLVGHRSWESCPIIGPVGDVASCMLEVPPKRCWLAFDFLALGCREIDALFDFDVDRMSAPLSCFKLPLQHRVQGRLLKGRIV